MNHTLEGDTITLKNPYTHGDISIKHQLDDYGVQFESNVKVADRQMKFAHLVMNHAAIIVGC